MSEIAEDAPPSVQELEQAIDAGLAWCSIDHAGTPVAYLMALELADSLHVEQVSVHAEYSRRGLGAALINECHEEGRRRGYRWLTLTTFRDVPWNAPYYERIGFREVAPSDMPRGLADIREREADVGLDRWPRCAMRRSIPQAAT